MNREPTMVDVALDAARRIGAASRDDEIAKLKAENKRLHDELEDCAEWCAKNRIEQLEADCEKLLQLLESASEVIGRFVSDEGWAQSDMDMMDTIDAEVHRRRRG